MILNSKMNNFLITLPDDWLYPDVIEKYTDYYKSGKNVYSDITSFLNASVQNVSLPDISLGLVKQFKKNNETSFRSGNTLKQGYTKEMTITFKLSENYLNHMILRDQLERYMDRAVNDKVFMPDLALHMMDYRGRVVMSQIYTNIVFFGITTLDISMTNVVPETQTFDIQLAYHDVKIKSYKD